MYGLIKMQNPGLPAEENLSDTVFGEMDKNKVMTLLHMYALNSVKKTLDWTTKNYF